MTATTPVNRRSPRRHPSANRSMVRDYLDPTALWRTSWRRFGLALMIVVSELMQVKTF